MFIGHYSSEKCQGRFKLILQQWVNLNVADRIFLTGYISFHTCVGWMGSGPLLWSKVHSGTGNQSPKLYNNHQIRKSKPYSRATKRKPVIGEWATCMMFFKMVRFKQSLKTGILHQPVLQKQAEFEKNPFISILRTAWRDHRLINNIIIILLLFLSLWTRLIIYAWHNKKAACSANQFWHAYISKVFSCLWVGLAKYQNRNPYIYIQKKVE